jgi:hypothetical protein
VEGALTRVQASKMREPRNPSTASWLPRAWFDSSQATKHALEHGGDLGRGVGKGENRTWTSCVAGDVFLGDGFLSME